LIGLYLIYDTLDLRAPATAQIQVDVNARLAIVEPVFALNDALREKVDVLRGYDRFLEPYVAIETAAEQGIVGVEHDDPRWLSLDAVDRDLARSNSDNIQWLQHQIGWHSDSNLRLLPVFNIKDYVAWYVFVDRQMSQSEASRKLQANLRVARAFDQSVPDAEVVPQSFSLAFFLDTAGYTSILGKLTEVETVGEQQIVRAADYLDSFCKDNDILFCSHNAIRNAFDRGALKLLQPDEAEKIQVSIFPTGLETGILIKCTPIVLFASFFFFISQHRRRVVTLRAVDIGEHRWLLDAPWLWAAAVGVAKDDDPGMWPLLRWTVLTIAFVSILIQVLVQFLTSWFAFEQWQLGIWSAFWWAAALLSGVLTLLGVAYIVREELRLRRSV